MTEPALETTFDTSLIDLSQETNDPAFSFSTTESITSRNDGNEEPGVQLNSQVKDWEETAMEAISDQLPKFISALSTSNTKPTRKTMKVAIVAAGTGLEGIQGPIERLEQQTSKALCEKAQAIEIMYQAVSLENLDKENNEAQDENANYHGAIVLIGLDENDASEECARFFNSLLYRKAVMVLCELQSKDHCGIIHGFEDAGFSLIGNLTSKEVGNDMWVLVSVLQLSH